MEQVTLAAQKRQDVQKKENKKLRKSGRVLGVVYGQKDPYPVSVDEREFSHLLHGTSGSSTLIELKFADDQALDQTVMVKELQFHPLKGSIAHVDFLAVSMTEEVSAKVPLEIKGEAIGARSGGVLEHHLWEAKIRCLPNALPDQIKVDVSSLEIGQSLHVRDIQPPEGVVFDESEDEIVVAVLAPRVEKEVSEEDAPSEPEVIGKKAEEPGQEESK